MAVAVAMVLSEVQLEVLQAPAEVLSAALEEEQALTHETLRRVPTGPLDSQFVQMLRPTTLHPGVQARNDTWAAPMIPCWYQC